MSDATGLRAIDISCRRGGRLLFAGVSFSLRPGEGLLLTGPNGTGKTSLLRMIAGLLPLEAGEIQFRDAAGGTDLADHLHYIGHANGVKTSMSVRENLAFWTEFYGADAGRLERSRDGNLDESLALFGLDAIADLPAGLLSAGQKRKLALSRLIAAPRTAWLLDEPSVSLDVASTKTLAAAIGRHLKDGGMAMIASHTPLAHRFAHKLDLTRFADAVEELA